MLEREKNILKAFLAILVMILFSVAVYYISKLISPWIIVGAFVLVLYCYALPIFIKRYYIYHGVGNNIGISRFIPIYSELTIYSHGVAIAYLVSFLLVLISGICMFIKPEVIANLLGDDLAMNWGNYAIVIFIFSVILWSIIKGIGFSALVREINADINYAYLSTDDRKNGIDGIVVALQYILLFLPVFRTMGILLEVERINKLVLMKKVTADRLTAFDSKVEFEDN